MLGLYPAKIAIVIRTGTNRHGKQHSREIRIGFWKSFQNLRDLTARKNCKTECRNRVRSPALVQDPPGGWLFSSPKDPHKQTLWIAAMYSGRMGTTKRLAKKIKLINNHVCVAVISFLVSHSQTSPILTPRQSVDTAPCAETIRKTPSQFQVFCRTKCDRETRPWLRSTEMTSHSASALLFSNK